MTKKNSVKLTWKSLCNQTILQKAVCQSYVHFDSNINVLCATSQERKRKWLNLGYLLLPNLWNITYSAFLFHFWIFIKVKNRQNLTLSYCWFIMKKCFLLPRVFRQSVYQKIQSLPQKNTGDFQVLSVFKTCTLHI